MGGEKLFQSPLFRLPLGSPPRGRGKANKAMDEISKAGSPPHRRGKVGFLYQKLDELRITPA